LALLDEHIEGKYEILEKLREGGMGAIYRVRHRLLDEIRVVKVIRSAVAGNEDAGERFLREARAAIRLRHPNIAALHDFAIAGDGNAYIVMEYIDGSTLQEVLDRHGPPPLSLLLEIARQALRALGYLHRQKIVHRDVSPDNLMLTQDVDGHAFVKLIDLGIAKALEEAAAGLTSTGVFLGKPRYASPEQFSGQGLDARSDLYSFGIVLYEMLTGRCPIEGSNPASYLAGHLIRPPLDFAESDPEGRVPPALREIVLRALAKKPEERFADAEEFVWALTLIREEELLVPVGTAELAALLRPPAAKEKIVPFPARPGSTQDQLDREFFLTLTPPPSSGSPLLNDMTWVTAPVRPAGPPLTPAPPAPAPARLAGAQIGLGLAAVLVLAAGGGFWWVRSQRTEPIAPPPALVAPGGIQPMQPGALIRRGMPNVEPPVPIEIPAYSYPAAARGSGRKVSVRVRLLVDENGRVLEAAVRDPEGSVFGFDEAALAAARKVVFQAATRDGVPGKMWTEMIFEFRTGGLPKAGDKE
jgi:serine/threonine-protein kinase